MKYILSAILLTAVFTSCEKEKKATLYISGHIYNNCYDKRPYRNAAFRLYQTKNGSTSGRVLIASDSTDANGYFKTYFPPGERQNTMVLGIGGGSDFMEGIPPTGNIDSLNVYIKIFANIKVSLKIINPHNIGDTLDIKYLGAQQSLKITCPLSSGPIYTALNYSPINTTFYGGTDDNIVFGFKPSTGFVYTHGFKIDKYCKDTVYVTVDIK